MSYFAAASGPDEGETEEERFKRFFGGDDADVSTKAREERAEAVPPSAAPLEASSPAAAYLHELVTELLEGTRGREERSTALLAVCAASAFVSQLPGAARAFGAEGGGGGRRSSPSAGVNETLLESRGARLGPLPPAFEPYDGDDPPRAIESEWAVLVGRPWPLLAAPPRARRYSLCVRRGVLVEAEQTSSGHLGQADALRHLTALGQCVDALGRCGLDLRSATVLAWVDDEISASRARPLAHLIDYEAAAADSEATGEDDAADDRLALALRDGPSLLALTDTAPNPGPGAGAE